MDILLVLFLMQNFFRDVLVSALKVSPVWVPSSISFTPHQRNKPVRVNESHNSFISRSERLSYSETLIINPITNESLLAYFISPERSYEVHIVIPSLFLRLLLLRPLNIVCIFHVLAGFAPLQQCNCWIALMENLLL